MTGVGAEEDNKNGQRLAMGTTYGMLAGVVIGLLMRNLGLGIGIGMCMGVSVASAMMIRDKNKKK